VNKEQYAPWERGFDSDRALKNEASRKGELKIRQRPASSSQRDPLLLSSAQWVDRKRSVLAGAAPVKVVVTKAGHPLRLFSFEQTTQI
jgi:hypothetical protein